MSLSRIAPLLVVVVVAAVRVTAASPATGDSTPIGPLPKGPVTSIETARGALVAVALPRQNPSTARLARRPTRRCPRPQAALRGRRRLERRPRLPRRRKGQNNDPSWPHPRRLVRKGASVSDLSGAGPVSLWRSGAIGTAFAGRTNQVIPTRIKSCSRRSGLAAAAGRRGS